MSDTNTIEIKRQKQREAQRRYRERHPDRYKAIMARHDAKPERKAAQAARAKAARQAGTRAASTAAYRASETYKETRKAYEATESRKEYLRAWRKTPETKARRAARVRQRRKSDPVAALENRMRVGVRRALASGKQGTPTFALLGFTAAALAAHLERQFLPGMSWENLPKWHVDHIVPLSAFPITTAGDEAFRAAWALSNLRPIWGGDNIAKSAKREFLL